MSVRFRLNALIVALSSLGVSLLVAAMVIGAGPRIHAENDSIMRLAKEFVETTVASLQGTSDPGARLQVLLDGLKELRHVHIYRIDDHAPHVPPEEPLTATRRRGWRDLVRRRRASRCRWSSTDRTSARWSSRRACRTRRRRSGTPSLASRSARCGHRRRRRAAHEYADRPSSEAHQKRRRRPDRARSRDATMLSSLRRGRRRSPTSAASSIAWRRRWRLRSRRTGAWRNASSTCRTRSAKIWRASCTTSSAHTSSPSGRRLVRTRRSLQRGGADREKLLQTCDTRRRSHGDDPAHEPWRAAEAASLGSGGVRAQRPS